MERIGDLNRIFILGEKCLHAAIVCQDTKIIYLIYEKICVHKAKLRVFEIMLTSRSNFHKLWVSSLGLAQLLYNRATDGFG